MNVFIGMCYQREGGDRISYASGPEQSHCQYQHLTILIKGDCRKYNIERALVRVG